MLQNGQTELRKVCFKTFLNLPEGVYRYVERRSLFIAKRLKMKKNRRLCDFSTLFYTLKFVKTSDSLIYPPFCDLDFFCISFIIKGAYRRL